MKLQSLPTYPEIKSSVFNYSHTIWWRGVSFHPFSRIQLEKWWIDCNRYISLWTRFTLMLEACPVFSSFFLSQPASLNRCRDILSIKNKQSQSCKFGKNNNPCSEMAGTFPSKINIKGKIFNILKEILSGFSLYLKLVEVSFLFHILTHPFKAQS